MRKFNEIPVGVTLLLITSLVTLFSCEKNNSSETPGKTVDYTQPTDTSVQVAEAPADTIVSTPDTVKAAPEIPRVTSGETAELIQYMEESPDAEKYASGILYRMAEDSPEYTRKLLNSSYSHFIIVDKQAMELALFDRYGREELRYGIACGKNFGSKAKKGDCRTSEGFFSAEGIYDSTDWLYTDDNGRTSKKKGQFGPRFVRLKIPGTTAIGIHGTCAPGSIGRRASHGCIRVKNNNILELVKHVTVGMPIIVSPSDRDVKVNNNEGRYIAQVTINPNSKRNPIADKKLKEKAAEEAVSGKEGEEKTKEETASSEEPSKPNEAVEEPEVTQPQSPASPESTPE